MTRLSLCDAFLLEITQDLKQDAHTLMFSLGHLTVDKICEK